MVKKLSLLISITLVSSLFIVSLFLSSNVFAQTNFRSNEKSVLSMDEVINTDYFAWGSEVFLSGTVNGDAYLAGGDINVDGVVNGDLLVAGGDINIEGFVNGDIRVLGGDVKLSGKTARNVSVAGGSVNVLSPANIGGSLSVLGGDVSVSGPVAANVNVASGRLSLKNKVGGDLNYFSKQQADISREATISGKVNRNITNKLDQEGISTILRGVKTGVSVLSLLSSVVVGIVILLLVPNFTAQVATLIIAKPGRAVGVGVLVFLLTPLVIALLFITLIGIPISLALLFVYLFLIYISKIFVGVSVGKLLEKWTGQKGSLIKSFIFGMVTITVLRFIPVIDWLVSLTVLFLGIGGFILVFKNYYINFRAKKLT